ncbi:RNA polymerase sigma factor [Plectonema radiosum NIES-515]|uniref:RNA polymerase sigma factor n=1 Tax=Plectonema radiosum NIES-515 TaxID=2986073 RepID=A0ABT3B4Y8_9CYAN|nr:RNA polymerase sigma factor [Plectonema radiosum]MCV3216440.1 RNA polymerase sigma factor [Plectonema radiosum NIES-515]
MICEEYRDELYRCCLKWMNGNRIDAEDALSDAMLKAWEKVQKYVGEIANFKAWLIRVTHNLCIDIHRERDRVLKQIENIDAIAPHEEQRHQFQYDTLVSDLEQCEKKIVIHHAINNLPTISIAQPNEALRNPRTLGRGGMSKSNP